MQLRRPTHPHYCGTTRKGRFMVQRKTQRVRMVRKLKELRLEMKKRQHEPLAEQRRWLASVLRGHYAYFGITGGRHYQVPPRRRALVALGAASARTTPEASLGAVHRDPDPLPTAASSARTQLALLRSRVGIPDGRAQCGKAARWDL